MHIGRICIKRTEFNGIVEGEKLKVKSPEEMALNPDHEKVICFQQSLQFALDYFIDKLCYNKTDCYTVFGSGNKLILSPDSVYR